MPTKNVLGWALDWWELYNGDYEDLEDPEDEGTVGTDDEAKPTSVVIAEARMALKSASVDDVEPPIEHQFSADFDLSVYDDRLSPRMAMVENALASSSRRSSVAPINLPQVLGQDLDEGIDLEEIAVEGPLSPDFEMNMFGEDGGDEAEETFQFNSLFVREDSPKFRSL